LNKENKAALDDVKDACHRRKVRTGGGNATASWNDAWPVRAVPPGAEPAWSGRGFSAVRSCNDAGLTGRQNTHEEGAGSSCHSRRYRQWQNPREACAGSQPGGLGAGRACMQEAGSPRAVRTSSLPAPYLLAARPRRALKAAPVRTPSLPATCRRRPCRCASDRRCPRPGSCLPTGRTSSSSA